MTGSTDNPRKLRSGHGKPTLQDVADLAGVTRMTVSRCVRNPTQVAPETAARVQAAIEQTGYVPNHQAGQLASGASRIVAALIPNVGHSIFAETIQGLTDGLHGTGFELLLFCTGYSIEREEAQLRALLGWSPAALLVTGRRHSAGSLRLMRQTQAAGKPVVEMWDHHQSDGAAAFAQIGFDHALVGRAMARHFLAQGHTHLAYVDSGVAADFRAHERGEGFGKEARRVGATVKVLRARTGDAFDAGRDILQRLLDAKQGRVTAVAFANDHLACGALMEAQTRGLDIPADLALLGFGDFPIGRQLRPALSTVRPPSDEIGRVTALAITQAISAGTDVASQALPCELVVRDSAGVRAGDADNATSSSSAPRV
jgi:LacI family gluconate utilization system Gnt-I transcriptional repressor